MLLTYGTKVVVNHNGRRQRAQIIKAGFYASLVEIADEEPDAGQTVNVETAEIEEDKQCHYRQD